MGTLTLQAKLIIAAIIAALIGYSYFWTFQKGEVVGRSDQIAVAYKNLTNSLQEQADADALEKKRQLEEARKVADDQNKYNQRKIANLENSNKILEEEKNVLLAKLSIPDELIGVLNDARNFSATGQ